MKPVKGYYSIVQFCPDLERAESVNIGVVLLVPDRGVLRVRMLRDNSRIRHVFSVSGDDLKQLNRFKKSFESRIESETTSIRTPEQFQRFIDTRGNFIQLTPPRYVKVVESSETLKSLFSELVGVEKNKSDRVSFQKSVQALFDRARINHLVKQNVSVALPQTQHDLHVPFGFQNRSFHLLVPENFDAQREETNFNRACIRSMHGQFVRGVSHDRFGKMSLRVIGRFRSKTDEAIPVVRQTLKQNSVSLILEDDLSDLVAEIRQTAKPIVELDG